MDYKRLDERNREERLRLMIIPGLWPTPVAVQRTLTAVQII